MTLDLRESVPLAPLTTLRLGGSARFFVAANRAADVPAALRWAADRGLEVFILGGGSNLVVADEGFSGLVLRLQTRGLVWTQDGQRVTVEVQAGEDWDAVVEQAAERAAAGIECLAGIPGTAGAAPVQNIGAYGQEVGDVLCSVRAVDRQTLQVVDIPRSECGFAYRDSIFKRASDRFVILAVTLGLSSGARPVLRYGELTKALAGGTDVDVEQVRRTVLGLRRRKAMVLDDGDPDGRSAGSFFMNPVVAKEEAERIADLALSRGALSSPDEMPRFQLPDGRIKLAAGWLIERSGVTKGFRMGPVGVSSKHALALVHHGGGRTADLLRLALHVRARVADRFGITLVPEPVFLGLTWPS